MKQNNKIRLGLMAPLSGIVQLYGSEISNAGIIACSEVNEAGGVLGHELELILVDDGSMPETSVPAAKRLIQEFGCVAIIGNLLSNSRIAVSTLVSEPLKVPYLNFSFYEGSISGKYFFHFAALPNQQIDRMIPYMHKTFGPKMFFAGNNYEWPRGSIDAAKKALLKKYGEIVGEEYLPIGTSMSEIDELLVKVASSGADVFIPYFAGIDQINLLTQFTKKGLKKRMAVVMGHYDEAMVSLLSPEIREGFYSSNTYFMSIESEKNRLYLDRLAKLDGINGIWPSGNGVLTNFGEGTYLCVKAFAKAVNQASSIDSDAVVSALETIEVEGPQGIVVMDSATHHAKVNTYLSRCDENGVFSIIESFGQIPPVIPERYKENTNISISHDDEITTPIILPSLSPIEENNNHHIEDVWKGQNNYIERYSNSEGKRGSVENRGTGFQKLWRGLNDNECGITSQILETADVAIIAVNRKGIILEANRNAYRQFGYELDELTGNSIHLLVPPNVRKRHVDLFNQFAEGSIIELFMGRRGGIQGYRKDGTLFPAEVSISKFFHDNQWVFVATLRDISDRKKVEETLIWRATHDSLTKLPNRTLIKERLTNALIRTNELRKDVELTIENNAGVLFIDCDGFKLVNDTYGHDVGDELLIQIAGRLINDTRPGDTVGRLGGDEFVILCENIRSEQTITTIAGRINETLKEPFDLDSNKIKVYISASIGIALGHGSTHSAEDLLKDADAAMYIVKERGKDGWHLFSDKIYETLTRKLSIINGLKTAIEQNEFTLAYQPIVAANSTLIRGSESLIRWNRPDGPVSPAHFIPVAESNGSIISIGRWVFREACKTVARIQNEFGNSTIPYTSINVSTRQLNEEGIVAEFTNILNETGAKPENIVIEITETSLMVDINKNIKVLKELASLGIKVAVDDFGTGYSSLLQLLRMPVSIIKIDREFIDGLHKKPESRAIASAVIKMAKVMGKKTIAEGVENDAELFELQAQGCDMIQGFYFYRPMPADDYINLLKQRIMVPDSTNSPKVYTVIYVSKASESITDDELKQILNFARKNNSELGVTGFLIYNKGYFLQLLEGRQDSIDELLGKIVDDQRHNDVRIVLRTFNERRLFSDWTMGYWNMKETGSDIDFSTWQKQTFSLLEISNDAKLCYSFFEALSSKNL
jgi:diguanylate cyclase (GGDEF)-like protein/PAS domain S-box-containing protein